MHIDGADFGYATEEVTIPIPTPVTQEYRGGGMDLGVALPMMAIEPLESTVKMSGHDVDIMKLMALGPNNETRVHFRGGVLSEVNGVIQAHVVIMQGNINGGSHDTWQRGEKSGLEFVLNGISYFKYTVEDETIHEIGSYPPKRIVNGVDQLASLNSALGY
jgi:P2 family phage contractile tail tube protein